MRDKFGDVLASTGTTNERQVFFQKSFLGGKKIAGVRYDQMPKQYREYVDSVAVSVLDPNGGKVIITGNPLIGKSFLVEQLYFNRQVFMDRAKLSDLEFVNVTSEHVMLVAQNFAGRWVDYVELASNVHTIHQSDLIFITESLEAAVGITSVGGRVVLEATPQTLHQLSHHESLGAMKQWNSWEVIDLNDVHLDKAAMVAMLAEAHLGTINTEYPEIALTRKHVALLVDFCVKEGELLITEDMNEELVGRLVVQPGLMARTLFRFASTLALDGSMRDASGKLRYAKAIKDAYANFEAIFFQAFHDFIMESDMDDDDAVEEAIRNALESAMPGAQVTKIFGTSTKQEKVAAIPVEFSDFTSLQDRLKETVMGQDQAIADVVNGLKITAAGLNMDTKPLRSLLFLGPTGVGKTQLSLSLAKELMTTEMPVKRIDMSEFGSAHEAAKLLGAPPGYLGHEAGGVLTNFVKENPVSVVIMDEIEKAHPKVWDSFLQILDAGRMTDSLGKTIDFTKTLVIMTSNIGADRLKRNNLGFSTTSSTAAYLARVSDAKNTVKKALEEEFRPEMVNRFDDIVVFNELPNHILHQVIAKELDRANERLQAKGYVLETTQVDILEHIAGLSDVSKYGAREVQRVVGTSVLQLLADEVLLNNDRKSLTLKLQDDELSVDAKVSDTDGEAKAE